MASTEWANEDIDRIFEAITAAIFDAAPVDNVASATKEANALSVWPEVVFEDILDSEYLES